MKMRQNLILNWKMYVNGAVAVANKLYGITLNKLKGCICLSSGC